MSAATSCPSALGRGVRAAPTAAPGGHHRSGDGVDRAVHDAVSRRIDAAPGPERDDAGERLRRLLGELPRP